MEFHYYFLIQDAFGVFIAFIYSRLVLMNLKLIFKSNLDVRKFRLLIYHSLFLYVGIFLCINKFHLKSWFYAMIIVAAGLLVKPKYKVNK